MNELTWPVATPFSGVDSSVTLLLLAVTAVFCLHAYPLSAEAWRARFAARGADAETAQARGVLSERWTSALAFATLALVVAMRSDAGAAAVGLGPPRIGTTMVWTLAVLALTLPFVARSATTAAMMELYPQIRVRRWSSDLARRSALSTAVYLFGYELLFRGVLVFGLVGLLGAWPGLATATAIYVLAHLRKGVSETLACIPMGYVFGLMALQTNSIWGPWFVHVAVALLTEVRSARANPAIEYPI